MRLVLCFFFQAEDGIRDLVRSRGLGDVYKRQLLVGIPTLRLKGDYLAIATLGFGEIIRVVILNLQLSLIHI